MQMARKKTDTVQLKLRFSEALRRRLEREAKQQKQSLNGEIISRLEQSFRKAEDADLIASTFRAAWGGPTGDLLRAIVTAIWLIEKRTGKKWNEDTEAHLNTADAINYLVYAFAHPPVPAQAVALSQLQKMMTPEEVEHLSEDVARSMGAPKEEVLRMLGGVIQKEKLARGIALEALQKMGIAPQAGEAEQK
jgi:hypothetical protein